MCASRVSTNAWPWMRAALTPRSIARMALRDAMLQSLDGKPYAGILVALAIGQQNAISAEQWREFWRTGTGHLMSISGPYIMMMAA